jgi:hypothetical protein
MGLFKACTCLGMVDKQVPIVSKVKCVSIKGKGLMWLRAPPTDRIWFAFKEMPDLDLVTKACDRQLLHQQWLCFGCACGASTSGFQNMKPQSYH